MTKLEHLARAVGHFRRAGVELRLASADLGTPAIITAGHKLAEVIGDKLAELLEEERARARGVANALAKKGGGA